MLFCKNCNNPLCYAKFSGNHLISKPQKFFRTTFLWHIKKSIKLPIFSDSLPVHFTFFPETQYQKLRVTSFCTCWKNLRKATRKGMWGNPFCWFKDIFKKLNAKRNCDTPPSRINKLLGQRWLLACFNLVADNKLKPLWWNPLDENANVLQNSQFSSEKVGFLNVGNVSLKLNFFSWNWTSARAKVEIEFKSLRN